ncbi:hypothetical protein TBLA_0F01310 [Henningerozyma blattae CBS 6284]|uniref:Nucleoporin Nup82 n=1 Tax=Henningerozyma blattae (strain ATCC 34711 / CBS 6284 / DSM 70876 / NBRC 10599 / NRRL Y-10934 / UCD 77-7) TaxID=1071380 RepID=I2H5M2_HENB6|nr:hypothetical protein TBLA_0F01310 [Tetrapisispora blattae CBS 6284]CCH61674.1 hypothetical protein TBLA_0F01310 [Tetrapisispora blattae CBS 6284]
MTTSIESTYLEGHNPTSHPIFKRNYLSSSFQETSPRFFFTTNRDNRVVVVQDGSIRWCYTFSQNYHSYTIASRNFDIKDSLISNSGSFVCYYSDTDISIMEIPWSHSNSVNASSSHCIQKYRYSFKKYSLTVKQVLFHPLATLESCLVVLLSDDTIVFIDFSKSFDLLSSDYILNKKSKSIGLSSQISDIQSLTFSQDGLTLYALSSSAATDVYAFYPCLPPSAQFSLEQLENLVNKSVVQYEELREDDPTALKINIIKQLKFTSDLYKKGKRALEEDTDSKTWKYDVPLEYRLIRPQGPFTISPFPDSLYYSSPTHIVSVPIDTTNELLVLSFSDGSVVSLFQDLELTMSWDQDNFNENNSLVLLELIKTKEQNIRKLTTYAHQYGTFYILGSVKNFEVLTSHWSSTLAICIKSSDIRDLSNLLIKSVIKPFDNAAYELTSGGWWCSPTISSLLFINKSTVIELNEKPKLLLSDDTTHLLTSELAQKYIPPLEDKIFKIELPMGILISDLNNMNTVFKEESNKQLTIPIPSQERNVTLFNKTNENQLETLTKISKVIGIKISMGQSLGFGIYNKILDQQNIVELQLRQTQRLLEKEKILNTKYNEQADKLRAFTERQEKLMSRLLIMNEKLKKADLDTNLLNISISKKELEFFKEIRKQVLLFNEFVHKQKDQHDTLLFIKKELIRIKGENAIVDENDFKQWDRLRDMLHDDATTIETCTESIKNINFDLDRALKKDSLSI